MQRSVVCKATVRRLAPLYGCRGSVVGPGLVSCQQRGSQAGAFGLPAGAATGALQSAYRVQVRRQSAATDKRFHCSVCKKAFRLEMAAKVHIQQAHGGEASVEVGSGPGQPNAAQKPPLVSPHTNAPPQGPTIIEEIPIPDERPLRRRGKPTPKPLHGPHRDVPQDVLEDMLSVWDAVGVKRLEGKFVHSSMVMKVFAAKPDAGSEPLYDPVVPEGESPFADARSVGQGGTAEVDGQLAAGGIEEHNIYALDLNDAFAIATDEHHGPFRVARCENPFAKGTPASARLRFRTVPSAGGDGTAATGSAPLAALHRSPPVDEEPQTAPVTPYGQLPMFGQAPQALPVVQPPSFPGAGELTGATPGVVASPFAASVTDSPFAQQVSSPFAPSPLMDGVFPASEGGAEAAPVAAPASPFTAFQSGAAPSPFTNMGADSPFGGGSPLSGAVGMPAADPSMFAGAAAPTSFPSYQTLDGVGMPAAAVEKSPQHECSLCGKMFSSYDGMRMHAKAKHGVELPRQDAAEAERTKRVIPELPAYIPSPVDLSTTVPFGKRSIEESWTETEIVPHAVSVSNITITGRVLDVERLEDGVLQIIVYVAAEPKDNSETLTVRVPAASGASPAVKRNDTVFVSGSLRLLPIFEPATNKYYSTPIIFAACPTGLVQKIC